ncbi:MAG: ester cyclase [Proteobacteria bacterium]|nr:ester cyclase [Pseudomonadota bacterium]
MDMVKLADRYFDSWNSHHTGSVLKVFGPGGTLCGPLALHGVTGSELASYANRLWRAFPDFFVQAEQPVFCSKRVYVEWILRGTHEGELFGWSATGRPVALKGVDVIDCRIPRRLMVRSFYDALELWRQIQSPESTAAASPTLPPGDI